MGGVSVFALGVLERRWRRVPSVVWGMLPVGLMLFGGVTSALRLEGLEGQLSLTGGRWVLSRMAHEAVAAWEPMWVSGWVAVTLLTWVASIWVGLPRMSHELMRAPLRFLFIAALGALAIAVLSGGGGLQMTWAAGLFVGIACIARVEETESRVRVFLMMATIGGAWTLAWTGWVTQWEALVMGDLSDDLEVLGRLPAWGVPWWLVIAFVGAASMLSGRGKAVGRTSWWWGAVFAAGDAAPCG